MRLSLIDPSTRWWNQKRPRRVAAWVCWVVGTVAYFVGGWTMADSMTPSADAIPASPPLLVGGFVLAMAGMFLYFVGDDTEDSSFRIVLVPTAALFVAAGSGDILRALRDSAEPTVTSVVFVVGGLCVAGAVEVFSRRAARNRVLRAHVERSGVLTSGTVTQARGYYIDYSPATRVTVKFTDAAGQTRWASQTIGGTVQVGARVKVRYSPEHLGRKAGVSVSA